jgi:CO dehydrogenase nickel-insertion accessory protein CooC1
LLGELTATHDQTVVSDLEAGVGTLLRMQPGHADVVLVACEPAVKSIEVARRAASIASERAAVTVVANRLRGPQDVAQIRSALPGHDLVTLPEEPTIMAADRDGVAPIDAAPDAPGVRAIVALARRFG